MDKHVYPGSIVLRNSLDIRDKDLLSAAESEIVAQSLMRLKQRPLKMPFVPVRLRTTHKAISGALYPWAGEFRQSTGKMFKQRELGGIPYADSQYIVPALDDAFRLLTNAGDLSKLDASALASFIARFYSELDAIHPFREGNSRTLRQFFSDLAASVGYDLRWARISGSPDSQTALYRARDRAVLTGDTRISLA